MLSILSLGQNLPYAYKKKSVSVYILVKIHMKEDVMSFWQNADISFKIAYFSFSKCWREREEVEDQI